ncbi:UDP-N-acetylmuramoyl-tripeptide--D-alanyl-D-alanine ligase [Pedobacter yulinensis]|uniref:UDP-N-acetylmuramoyl-tripeptide--D-alanyl-D-alanine ligase n=1 Tax=Pedobacter yulinensis TaxID=2126353 RepID=A0A2T3HRB9_9SPHI|nr:UDP-N-acetylmuramoyl-tripeptide--D-alanyl-D-alanine ligase [Pedobacter yulinensis]PST85004.1 UDP-N-acetylmuramoyl-tripeptide--D-alanyl-D-alanine ligase [Pedobacter yulinensis]
MSDIQSLYARFLEYPKISTDTRKIGNGSLFFALRGENFDANDFATEALNRGAAFAVVDKQDLPEHPQLIRVPDTLNALQELAAFHRQQLGITVIGLTGSNGKTTTKELVRAVLAEKFPVFATEGNLNNHIGVPLTILAIPAGTEIAIIEMGANHQREIAALCSIAQPTAGLISNVGMAHLEGFGGFEGVKKGKAELYDYLAASGGRAFINQDNPDLIQMAEKSGLKNLVFYGKNNDAFTSGELITADPFLKVRWKNGGAAFELQTRLTGAYNFENILAAVCIGLHFGMEPEAINRGLASYEPTNNRSQLTRTDRNTVICDFYNANPSSMRAAIDNLSALSAPHKTAILGDMFELGDSTAEKHLEIGRLAAQAGFEQLIFIGPAFSAHQGELAGLFFNEPAAAATYLEQEPPQGSLVLLKGSRGMKLEQLLPKL